MQPLSPPDDHLRRFARAFACLLLGGETAHVELLVMRRDAEERPGAANAFVGPRILAEVKRLLLVSNSTLYGSGYLDHCDQAMREFLGPVGRVLFVPFALHDRAAYAARARERLGRMGYGCDSVHEASQPENAVESAEAIFIGGGNTFRLLSILYERRLLEPLRRRVTAGVPYVGTSAGSNVACVTIKTTNDMPIVEPPSFDALNLVPFNINPHYLDPDPQSRHQGETREERLREFHEENDPDVVGLREGAMLLVEPPRVTLLGTAGARVFRKGRHPAEHLPGERLDFLLEPATTRGGTVA